LTEEGVGFGNSGLVSATGAWIDKTQHAPQAKRTTEHNAPLKFSRFHLNSQMFRLARSFSNLGAAKALVKMSAS
jgi:hypothetical protein